MAVPFLEMNFLVFVKAVVSTRGIEMLRRIELLAKAARWQGYVILEGFVPVRNMSHKRLATPKRSKFLFLNLDFLDACVVFLRWLFICVWPS